jgi:2-iminobutanoate/2-iminopropanoate deaminase
MPLQAIATNKAPSAVGPYSQAVSTGDLLFVSGQIPLDPETGELIAGDIEQRTEKILKNIEAIARKAGTDLSQVIKTTVFLTDLSVFQRFNAAYARFFGSCPPARSTVQVAALPLGSDIEIEAIISLE